MADLEALLIFAKVAEVKSFSEAARRLKMPTSTVSRRVSELEDQLGVRLLERSTRSLRLTDVGSDIYEYAQRGAEISQAVEDIVSYQKTNVSGLLRLSSPPNASDSLIVPLINEFQATYPNVRIQILVTERFVDHIAEGIDLAFRDGTLKDSSLVARKMLTYRHQLVATPEYLSRNESPAAPQDLLQHRLLAFGHLRSTALWSFDSADGGATEEITFEPHLSMNDYSGLAAALLAGVGIGELPAIVQPELIRTGRLVEVMPAWRFRPADLSVVHIGNRHVPRHVRLFKDFVLEAAPKLFPSLPT